MNNWILHGDNLHIMRSMNSGTIDLIYLDPPFNSGRNWSREGDSKYNDIWSSDAEYLDFMIVRLKEMHRLLKDTGSIYLHCDPTMSHYLKVEMDKIFGKKHFRSEIIWRIGHVSGFKTQKKGWIRNHDVILYYVKSLTALDNFNKQYIPYREGYMRYGSNEAPKGKGIPMEDTWNCHDNDQLTSVMIKSFSKEKSGYPTQKPVALLERIINASSNEGDTVFDPFCGSGTTLVAAKNQGRFYMGIDANERAVEISRQRLVRQRTIKQPEMIGCHVTA